MSGLNDSRRGFRPMGWPEFRPASQRGVATLIVVMTLFFVLSMVAAYSSRNIIFEQKTSSNLQAANVLQETAEAGIEWVLAQLNGGNITDACAPNLDVAAPTLSFRDRYLTTDISNGNVSGTAAYPAGGVNPVATCGFSQALQDWTCSCPNAGAAAAIPVLSPAFGVRFVVPAAARPGVIRVEVNACSQSTGACLTFLPASTSACRGTACVAVALQSGLKSPPIAALTARGNVAATSLNVYNTRPAGSGDTILAGGAVTLTSVNDQLRGPPGTPAELGLRQNDSELSKAAFTPERMFAAFLGAWPTTYDQHPAAVTVNCAAGCNSTTVRDAWTINPNRILLLQGDVALDGGADIGSPANPVLLVVQGNLTFALPTTVYGFVYARTADWVTAGNGQIVGGAAAQGSISGTGSFTVAHEPAILDLLRIRTGSLVRVPGSWVDFQ